MLFSLIDSRRVFHIDFDWRLMSKITDIDNKENKLANISMINLGGYQDQLTRLASYLYFIQPSSEVEKVVEEFKIPNYEEPYTDRYTDNIITKLVTYLPKCSIPFHIIDNFIEKAFDHYYHSNGDFSCSFYDLLSLCIDYTPEYDWRKMFERDLIYSFLIDVDDDNVLQIALIPYDKPLENVNIRPLLGFIFVYIIFIIYCSSCSSFYSFLLLLFFFISSFSYYYFIICIEIIENNCQS